MFSGSNIAIHGGTFNSPINHTSRGMDVLLEWVATGALHNSDELYDAPKCHPHTRVAVLDDIMEWLGGSESARDDFIMWLFGPAGAGKSAIAKRIAEIAAERDLLIADFFFSRASPTRNTKDRLVATLAYQLALSIPGTRSYIEDAIERDPVIFNKNILTQIDTLLIRPLQSVSSTQIVPSQKLIIIDGLDECNDSRAQLAILEAISRSFIQHNPPIIFLVVSRPEPDLVTSFNGKEPLKSIHRRLALDDTYRPDDDIRLFFSEKFEHIKRTHLLRSTIPIIWPTQEMLDTLVRKSSRQFIYASTLVKFVESSCHRPSARLNIILGISLPGRTSPFAELDVLYNHLLSSVDDIQITLRVLSLYIMTPGFTFRLRHFVPDMPLELFLSLEPGDIQLSLVNLSSILTYDESSGAVKVLHASLIDFLSDKHRSTTFHIDIASTCTDFVHRILEYVKGPDGIQAGDIRLFRQVKELSPWILKGQLRSDILNFDLDAFVNALITRQYKKHFLPIPGSAIEIFWIWKKFLIDSSLEDRDKNEALDRLNKYVQSRLQIYLSDWRLQLLLTLAVADIKHLGGSGILYCRWVDILLEMDDHDLHLVDQDALDLRHTYKMPRSIHILISSYVDGDMYASAALHCMRFLSKPRKYSTRNEHPQTGLLYAEWKATCDMTLTVLCILLQRANTSPELVQFSSNYDIHPGVQQNFPDERILEVDAHIFAFLSGTSVDPDWRTISLTQRPLVINEQQSSKSEGKNASSYEYEWVATSNLIQQRVDQCCSNVH